MADTFDAITSARPYRKGRSHGEALEIIKRASGTQLDPVVVEAFLTYYSGKRSLALWMSLSTAVQRIVGGFGNWVQHAQAGGLPGGAASIGAAVALTASMAGAVPNAVTSPTEERYRPASEVLASALLDDGSHGFENRSASEAGLAHSALKAANGKHLGLGQDEVRQDSKDKKDKSSGKDNKKKSQRGHGKKGGKGKGKGKGGNSPKTAKATGPKASKGNGAENGKGPDPDKAKGPDNTKGNAPDHAGPPSGPKDSTDKPGNKPDGAGGGQGAAKDSKPEPKAETKPEPKPGPKPEPKPAPDKAPPPPPSAGGGGDKPKK